MHKLQHWTVGVVLAFGLLVLPGCGDIHCTLLQKYSFKIKVKDSKTKITISDADVEIRQGEQYLEYLSYNREKDEYISRAARSGHFQLKVARIDYFDFTKNYHVDRDECHVITQYDTILLKHQ